MLNIKQVFFLMIALNSMLLLIFLKTSLQGSSNKHIESLQNDFYMKSSDHSDYDNIPLEEVSDTSAPVDVISDDAIDGTPVDEPEPEPMPEPELKPEPVVQTTEPQADDSSRDTDASSRIIDAYNYTGSSSIVINKDSLAETNEKIRNDPMLMELVKNFKELRKRHQDLTKRYRNVQFQNKKLKRNSTASKNQALTPNGIPLATKKKMDELTSRQKQVQMVLRYSNPLYLLGAYPNITLEYFNSYPDGRPFYERMNYGLHNDMDYCELTDLYNLAHPENMFKRKTFFTDYAKNGLPRKMVMRKMGYDLSPKISKYMPKRIFKSRSMHLDPRITMFFTKRVDLHIYHEIGKHFLCATQMYNHIPGHGVLKRKDMIVDSVDAYAVRYQKKSHCFNKHKFFPFSYRLYVKEECLAFFKEINSKEYNEKLKTDPIQYIIKIGYGSHRAQGVFLLDQAKTAEVRQTYRNGIDCGRKNQSLIAQTYVTNPLLLNFQNKFDFRIYMLIASTNPLIVYYHDGFLRVSLYEYDKFSNDRSTHLTNTHLSKDIFAEVRERNETLHGMNEAELRNYQMWTLERLQEYLLQSGKITDPNWLNNYLRPKFKEAFIHIVRMTSGSFWKQSNVFEMFGLDFMLDSDLNLWFIECNSSPQLIGTNDQKTNFLVKMMKDLFDIQFGYYKSRMKRVVGLIKKMEEEAAGSGSIDYTKWKKEFNEAWKNKFEPEFAVKSGNSFELIMDQNLKGPKQYFGYLKKECVDD